MPDSRKKLKKQSKKNSKKITNVPLSTDGEKSIWLFDMIDKNGPFAFDVNRIDFDSLDFIKKMIAYSNMTWREILNQTHDEGKSKHHFLDLGALTKVAQDRFKELKRDEYSDAIFSFAFTNKIRIIGIRDGKYFHVLWYDSEHQASISKKKHT